MPKISSTCTSARSGDPDLINQLGRLVGRPREITKCGLAGPKVGGGFSHQPTRLRCTANYRSRTESLVGGLLGGGVF